MIYEIIFTYCSSSNSTVRTQGPSLDRETQHEEFRCKRDHGDTLELIWLGPWTIHQVIPLVNFPHGKDRHSEVITHITLKRLYELRPPSCPIKE